MAMDYSGALSLVKSRGYGQSDLDRFLSGNTGDIGRVESAFSPQSAASTPTAAPTAALQSLASPGGGGGTAESPALAGLKSLSPMRVGSPSPVAGGDMGASAEQPLSVDPLEQMPLGNDFAGSLPLRQNLGTRIYPNESFALAGLKRAY